MKPWEQYQSQQKPTEAEAAEVSRGPWDDFKSSDSYKKGRKESSPVQRGVNAALGGPTLGFWDEIAGAISAPVKTLQNGRPLSENYREARDYVRGVQDQYKEDFPIGSPVVQGMTGSVLAAAPVLNAPRVAGIVSPLRTAGSAAINGAITGGISGLGESTAEDLGGMAWDSAKGAFTGSVLSAGMSGAGSLFSGAGRRASTITQPGRENFARLKVAEALTRDARGDVFENGAGNAASQARARFTKLGPEARVVDAGGQNTKQLLDTVATLPGRTKNATEQAILERQAGRGDRIVNAANRSLGTLWRDVGESITRLDTQRKTAARPFYDALQNTAVQVDDDVAHLLSQTKGIHGEAEKLWRLQTGQDVRLGDIGKGDSIPFSMLDTLKQSLYDASSSAKRQGNNKFGLALDDVRVALTNKLDDVAPKDRAGNSLYRLARDAYAGPSQLIDAAEAGTTAMTAPLSKLRDTVQGMSASEIDAFRVGALQSLREKAGTQAGQTNILKMWMERNTQDRLRLIFGNDYRQFAAAVARESRLKGLDQVGRGSQTAARQFGAGDLDVSPLVDAATTLGSVSSGHPIPVLTGVANMWNRVKTPEPIRDEMGRILLSRGQDGASNLSSMAPIIQRLNQQRAAQAALTGVNGGLLAPNATGWFLE